MDIKDYGNWIAIGTAIDEFAEMNVKYYVAENISEKIIKTTIENKFWKISVFNSDEAIWYISSISLNIRHWNSSSILERVLLSAKQKRI